MATTNKTEKEQEIDITPVQETKEKATKESETVSKTAFINLQQSFTEKCKQYDELANAYRGLQIKYISDAEAAKHFVKTALLGVDLLYPAPQQRGGRQ